MCSQYLYYIYMIIYVLIDRFAVERSCIGLFGLIYTEMRLVQFSLADSCVDLSRERQWLCKYLLETIGEEELWSSFLKFKEGIRQHSTSHCLAHEGNPPACVPLPSGPAIHSCHICLST